MEVVEEGEEEEENEGEEEDGEEEEEEEKEEEEEEEEEAEEEEEEEEQEDEEEEKEEKEEQCDYNMSKQSEDDTRPCLHVELVQLALQPLVLGQLGLHRLELLLPVLPLQHLGLVVGPSKLKKGLGFRVSGLGFRVWGLGYGLGHIYRSPHHRMALNSTTEDSKCVE